MSFQRHSSKTLTALATWCLVALLCSSCKDPAPAAPQPRSQSTPNPTGGTLGNTNGNVIGIPGQQQQQQTTPIGTPAPIVYPVLTLKGTGVTSCAEQLNSSASIVTNIDDSQLSLTYNDVHVDCYQQSGPFGIGACDQAQFDQQVRQQILGSNRFVRSTAAELEQLKSAGFNSAPFAIFAKSAVTNQGATYTFDKPLPVFPWPAVLSRYDSLNAGPQVWTATATGPTGPLSVTMQVSKRSGNDVEVQLQFDLTINGSQDHAIYDKFPVPRQAIYHINPQEKDVRAIESVMWFTDQNCQGMGQVNMNYRLCTKVVNGQTQSFGC